MTRGRSLLGRRGTLGQLTLDLVSGHHIERCAVTTVSRARMSQFRRKKKRGGRAEDVAAAEISCCFAESIFGCFVATAAFEDHEAPEVRILRAYRDEVLSQSIAGRTFTRVYYRLGPYPAAVIRGRPWLQRTGRRALRPVVRYAARRTRRDGAPHWA